MAVRIVSGNAAAEPDNVGRAEIFPENRFPIRALETRITRLHFAQQALFRGEQRAQAVDVDAPAFQHHGAAAVLRLAHGQLQLGQNAAHGGIVLAPVVVLGPGVEPPLRGGHAGSRQRPQRRRIS